MKSTLLCLDKFLKKCNTLKKEVIETNNKFMLKHDHWQPGFAYLNPIKITKVILFIF